MEGCRTGESKGSLNNVVDNNNVVENEAARMEFQYSVKLEESQV